jgi:hypothetical protein
VCSALTSPGLDPQVVAGTIVVNPIREWEESAKARRKAEKAGQREAQKEGPSGTTEEEGEGEEKGDDADPGSDGAEKGSPVAEAYLFEAEGPPVDGEAWGKLEGDRAGGHLYQDPRPESPFHMGERTAVHKN